MAMGAVAAHKLRSALTLLGVLVGVFSIIVVMTAMRAMQKKIEADLNQLGGQTFIVQTWPALYFEGPEGWQKYRRRKRIDLAQGLEVERRATLALSVGLEDDGLDRRDDDLALRQVAAHDLADRRNARQLSRPELDHP